MESLNLFSSLLNQDANGLVLIGGIFICIGLITAYALQWYRLSHVPGPLIASLTSLRGWRAMKLLNFHSFVTDAQEKHGKIVRIAPNDVLVSDPDTIWRINSARSPYERGTWYGSLRSNPYGHQLFSEMDRAKHDKRKAKLTPGFTGKGLVDLEGHVNTQLAVLVDVLEGKIQRGQGQALINIGRILQYFQVDLITLAGMGEAWGDLASDNDRYGYLSRGDVIFPAVHAISTVPFLRTVFFSPLFIRFFGPNPTRGWLATFHNAVEKRVEIAKTEQDGGDILTAWLKHGLTPAEAKLDLSLLLAAGTETSISTIRSILLYLMTSPRVYKKLRDEISEGIRTRRISSPVTNEEAKNLPYLQAVLNEGMRISPPTTAGFAKKVPPGGDVICGKTLPAGTEVHVNFISLMKDQEVFGSDVHVFRPERFIECDDTTRTKRLKLVDLNFGYGRWLCLGKTLAWLEMNKIFVELLRRFDFQILNPEKPWHRKSTIIWYIKDFNVRIMDDPIGSGDCSHN